MKDQVLNVIKTNLFVQHLLLFPAILVSTWILGSIITWTAFIAYGIYSANKNLKVAKEKIVAAAEEQEKMDLVHDLAQDCHWLNMFVHKYWATCIRMVLAPHIETLSQVLKASKPPFMHKLDVGKWELGKTAPKITQIYTPPAPNKKKYQMDCELLFAPDFFLEIKIAPIPKVTVTIRLTGIIVKGRMRLNFVFNSEKPNASVGSFSFIGDPHIQFQIRPMGSADMLSLPKVYEWINDIIQTSLNPMIVWPQTKEFTLGDGEPHCHHLDDEPITDICIINAAELKSPPGFVVISKTVTKLIPGSLNTGNTGDRLFLSYSREPNQEPITGLAIVCPSLGETVPEGFTMIEKTPGGESASLNAGNTGTEMYLCYSRDPSSPPIRGLAIMNVKELWAMKLQDRIALPKWNEYVWLDATPFGHKANLNRKVPGDLDLYLAYRGGCGSNFGHVKPRNPESNRGILRINLVEARNVKAADIGGTSDPFCDLIIGEPKSKTAVKKTSRRIDKTLNPRWDESFLFEVDANDLLTIKVYDYDMVGKNDFLGQTQLPLNTLVRGKEVEQWIPLELVSTGEIRIKMVALDFGLPEDQEITAVQPIASVKSQSGISKVGEGAVSLIFRSDSSSSLKKKTPEIEERQQALESKPLGDAFVKKEGHVEKLPSKKAIMGVGLGQGWQRRWLVLDKHRLKYYRSSKDAATNTVGSTSLKNATIEFDPELEFGFKVVSKAKVMDLKFANQQDWEAWYVAIATNIKVTSTQKSRFDEEHGETEDGNE